MKHIIFDFDGTLADSKTVFIAAFNQLGKKHGFNEFKLEDVEYIKSLSIKERCRFLNFPLYKIPFISADLYRFYKESIKQVTLMPGIRELLDQLVANGYKVSIISSNAEANIKEFLENNMIDHISDIICSNKIFSKHKMINKFLKANFLKRAEVLYIGDEQRDIIACRKSGVKIAWVSWGYDSRNIIEKENPDYIVEVPEEILSILKKS